MIKLLDPDDNHEGRKEPGWYAVQGNEWFLNIIRQSLFKYFTQPPRTIMEYDLDEGSFFEGEDSSLYLPKFLG